jgi:hypothetical protein
VLERKFGTHAHSFFARNNAKEKGNILFSLARLSRDNESTKKKLSFVHGSCQKCVGHFSIHSRTHDGFMFGGVRPSAHKFTDYADRKSVHVHASDCEKLKERKIS